MLCTFGVSEPKVPVAESLIPNEQLTEEDVQKAQRRLSAYRALIFWTYPAERKPLPSCVYGLVRAMCSPTADEEVFADMNFTSFVPEAQDDAR